MRTKIKRLRDWIGRVLPCTSSLLECSLACKIQSQAFPPCFAFPFSPFITRLREYKDVPVAKLWVLPQTRIPMKTSQGNRKEPWSLLNFSLALLLGAVSLCMWAHSNMWSENGQENELWRWDSRQSWCISEIIFSNNYLVKLSKMVWRWRTSCGVFWGWNVIQSTKH